MNILIQSRDLAMIARWHQCGTMTSQMLARASFSAVCLTVFPFDREFRPRTFTIRFYGKKLYHIRAYDFGVQFSFKARLWCNRKHGGRVSQRYRFESRRGEWALFSYIPSALERFCIPFYGIFKTESLSDRVRVRPAASRRWLSTKTVLHFVGRFGGFV